MFLVKRFKIDGQSLTTYLGFPEADSSLFDVLTFDFVVGDRTFIPISAPITCRRFRITFKPTTAHSQWVISAKCPHVSLLPGDVFQTRAT